MAGTELGPPALGDVVVLPDDGYRSLRAVVDLTPGVVGMAALWVLGELELVVARPVSPGQPFAVFSPVDCYQARVGVAATSAAAGLTRFWAAHLPSESSAMGEIGYRVLVLSGSVDPVLVFERGPERVTFVRTRLLWGSEIELAAMRRGPTLGEMVDPARYTALIGPSADAAAHGQDHPSLRVARSRLAV